MRGGFILGHQINLWKIDLNIVNELEQQKEAINI
jgi:hypothetical protein